MQFIIIIIIIRHLAPSPLTSWTENDPLVDDIITLRSVLSMAKVIKARLSYGGQQQGVGTWLTYSTRMFLSLAKIIFMNLMEACGSVTVIETTLTQH